MAKYEDKVMAASINQSQAKTDETAWNGSKESRLMEYLLITLGVLFVLVMLVLPLMTVLVSSFQQGIAFYVKAVTTKYVLSALGLTLGAALVAVIVSSLFGLCAAYAIGKFDFKGKQLLMTLIDIPFSVSPVIAGLAFIMVFGRIGWGYGIIDTINQWLGTNWRVVFALPGVFLATIFVTLPFVFREVIAIMHTHGREEEEAAVLMGASGLTVFWKITFPQIKWGFLYGVLLCSARALGEFGAVSALSKARGSTFTLPLEIDALELSATGDSITAAFAASSLLVFLSICLLIVRTYVEHRHSRG